MGKIILMPTTHISSEERGGLPRESGYNLIPESIIAEFFKLLRGGGGPDAFIIKLYYPNSGNPVGKMLMHGCVPPEGKLDRKRIHSNQLDLEAELDAESPKAFEAIGDRVSRNHQYRHHEKNMVFVKSSKGLIACGWYDSANSKQKGILMACYMLYAFGALNKSTDITLYNAVYHYLPFEGVFSSTRAAEAETIIVKCIGEQALTGKN